MQESVDVPEPPVIVVLVKLHVKPVVGEAAKVSVTVSEKPLAGVTVIVELRAELMLPLRLVGFAPTAKSSTVNIAVAECESVPLVPVIVSVYVPAMAELQDTVAVPAAGRLVGETGPQLRLVGMLSVKVTVPAKLFV